MRRFKSICNLIITASLILTLFGCSAVLERDFVYEEQHNLYDDESGDYTDIADISTYDDLKFVLLDSIAAYAYVQTVRLTDYTGDVQQDVQSAVLEAMETPLGSFAVNNIASQYSRILSYYEVRFEISYRRSKNEVSQIVKIEDKDALQRYMSGEMAKFPSSIIFEVGGYSWSGFDYKKLYQTVYYQNPRLAYGYSGIEVYSYPETGLSRIIEFNIDYVQSQGIIAEKASTAEKEAQLILDSYSGSNLSSARFLYLHDAVCAPAIYDEATFKQQSESEEAPGKSDPFTVYGTLIKKKAVGEGFALAFKLLCDMEDLDCIIVSGKLDGVPHLWNMVMFRGEWYHVDCSADALEGDGVGYAYFGVSDTRIEGRYTWERGLYPEAVSDGLWEINDLPEQLREESRYGDVDTSPEVGSIEVMAEPENPDETESGDAGETESGDAGETEPGDAGETEPGDAEETEPGDPDETEPGDAEV